MEKAKIIDSRELKKTSNSGVLEKKTYSIKEATEASKRALERLNESIVKGLSDTLVKEIGERNLPLNHSFCIFKNAMEVPTPHNIAEVQKILRQSQMVGSVRIDGIFGRETLKAMQRFVILNIEKMPAKDYPANTTEGFLHFEEKLGDGVTQIFKDAEISAPAKIIPQKITSPIEIGNGNSTKENIPSNKKIPKNSNSSDD